MGTLFATLNRVLRIARIGWFVRKTRNNSHSETERLLAKRALAALFADARGITMKVGQLFANSEGDDPLRDLVDSIEPLPLKIMLPLFQAEWGKPSSQVFQTLDESLAAASLGQVHRGLLKNGEEVAVKIRYPDIANAVEAELRLSGLMPGAGPVKRWGFDLEGYKQTLTHNMSRELDYRSEAERQQRYGEQVIVSGLRVPKIYPELCSESILVQQWLSGVRLDDVVGWSKKDRLRVGRTLIMTLFKSIFVAGEVHGDPHPGNTFYSHEANGQPVVNLLDYGCTVPVIEQRRLALLKLIMGCRENTNITPLSAFAAIGFDPEKLVLMGNKLPALCRILFRPFLEDRPFNLSQWQIGREFQILLGDHRWWFRSAGPADLFLLMRAFQGLVSQLLTLDVQLPWWPLLQQAVGDELLQRARTMTLPALPQSLLDQAVSVCCTASQLCVQVTEGGEPKVSLSMPAEAALDLENIIPTEVMTLIEHSENNDIPELVNQLRKNGLTEQTLVEMEKNGKVYRVWLE